MTSAGWQPDPYGRHEQRYYDGMAWTEHVADGGRPSTDPVAPGTPAAPIAPVPVPVPAPVSPYAAVGGQYVPGGDERTAAMWCHLGPLLLWALTCGLLGIVAWIVPLVIMNGKGRESAFVRHHASQALNFYIEMFIAGFIAGILIFVLIGFVLIAFLIVWSLVITIIAAVKASSGEWYRIPANLNFVS